MMEDHNHALVTQFIGATVTVHFGEEGDIKGKVKNVRGRWLEFEPQSIKNTHGEGTVHRVVNLDHVEVITYTERENE